MSRSIIAASTAECGTEFDREGAQNCKEIFCDLNLSRSVSAQGDISPQHKIAVFPRHSLVVTGFKAVHDLEDYAFCDLDECLPTVRMFSQDDCLHTEILPFQNRVHAPSRLGRARYNFQQGLLNTKEVMELKDTRLCQAVRI